MAELGGSIAGGAPRVCRKTEQKCRDTVSGPTEIHQVRCRPSSKSYRGLRTCLEAVQMIHRETQLKGVLPVDPRKVGDALERSMWADRYERATRANNIRDTQGKPQ